MKLIILTQGKTVKVDDADYEWLNQYKWQYDSGYAIRTIRVGKNIRKHQFMHRLIMQTPDGMQTDHINMDTLDNQRHNLRICTDKQNRVHRNIRKDSQSGVKGVTWHKGTGKWRALITIDNKQIHLGLFNNIEDAGKAYYDAAKQQHGEYAHTNIELH